MTPLFARRVRAPDCCSVCGRQAIPRALDMNRQGAAFWLCASEECANSLQVADMQPDTLTALETAALADGGNQAGAYLDTLRKTDLAALSTDEWAAFLRQVLEGFGASMRRQLAKSPIPF